MFYSQASANVRENIVGKQAAGSLRELQEKVKGLEEALQDMTYIMKQGKDCKKRGGEALFYCSNKF